MKNTHKMGYIRWASFCKKKISKNAKFSISGKRTRSRNSNNPNQEKFMVFLEWNTRRETRSKDHQFSGKVCVRTDFRERTAGTSEPLLSDQPNGRILLTDLSVNNSFISSKID